MQTTIPVILCALLLLGLATPAPAVEERKAVLITGATSGIGRMTAERLAEAGYFVQAGGVGPRQLPDETTISFPL